MVNINLNSQILFPEIYFWFNDEQEFFLYSEKNPLSDYVNSP